MRILYGVCGEGFGHSSRATRMIHHLLREGHEVLVVTYGQAYPVLKREGFDVLRIEGIELIFSEGVLSVPKTFRKNLKRLWKNVREWRTIKERIDGFFPEVCVSDMEPVVPIISFWYHLPLISLDNQHRLTHMVLKVPREYRKPYLIARAAVRQCVGRADFYLILSFHRGRTRGGNVFVVDPLLREEVVRLTPRQKNFVLVYLTKRDEQVLSVLKKIRERFVVYVFGSNREGKEGNVIFKKIGKGFLRDLAACKAVVATAGFTLIGEALYLKKPYFALPLKGQFEQTINALFLRDAGFGEYSEHLRVPELEGFLGRLRGYELRMKNYSLNPGNAIEIMDYVLERINSKKKVRSLD